MATPKPDTKVTVDVFIQREFRYVEINELIRRFPQQWKATVDSEGIEEQHELDWTIYESFIFDLVDFYGLETVLGGEYNDEITEIEVEE